MNIPRPDQIVSFFRKLRPPVGSRPGTLMVPKTAPLPEIHVWQYDEAGLETRNLDDVEQLAAYSESDRTTWIDVRGLGDEPTLRRIGEIYDLHPLALEDAVNVPQRAKSEHYEQHHLVIARIPMVQASGRIDVPQVAFFIEDRVLITFQERFFGFFEPVRERIRAGRGSIRSGGADYLAYALIDTLIDSYYPLAEELADRIDVLEDQVFEAPGSEVATRIHQARRGLVVLRRVSRPQRQAIRDLLTAPSPYVGEEVRIYLRDTLDHIAQIVELIDSSHEMAVGLMELNLANLSQRANDVMVVLTLMASVFIPLTFIAGVYGMNFEFMPELQMRWAYPAILGLMIAVGGGMLIFFRRRGWIGRRSGKKE